MKPNLMLVDREVGRTCWQSALPRRKGIPGHSSWSERMPCTATIPTATGAPSSRLRREADKAKHLRRCRRCNSRDGILRCHATNQWISISEPSNADECNPKPQEVAAVHSETGHNDGKAHGKHWISGEPARPTGEGSWEYHQTSVDIATHSAEAMGSAVNAQSTLPEIVRQFCQPNQR